MPWTRKQVRLLLSKASPLSGAQQDRMKSELHQNPALGHMRKGYSKTMVSARLSRAKTLR